MRTLIDLIESSESKSVAWTTKEHDCWIATREFGGHAITCTFERDPKKGWMFEFTSKKLGTKAEPDARAKNMQILGFVVGCLSGFVKSVSPRALTFVKAVKMTALYTALSKFLGPQVEAMGYRIVQPTPGMFVIQPFDYQPGQTIG